MNQAILALMLVGSRHNLIKEFIMRISTVFFLAAVALNGLTAFSLDQTPCDNLKSLALQDAVVTAAEYIPEGPYKMPSIMPGMPEAAPVQLPAYCRVSLILTPSKDSKIESEVWLPAKDWNGKLQVVGNGGWAGSVSYFAMPPALKDGYATASTDTGHKANDGGGNGLFALGHPEKIIDFGYRALHETTVKAKEIIRAYYERKPAYSYYNGCSTGGRQGLVEASRFPEDFDGIVAGAPANPHIYLHAAGIELNMELRKNPQLPLTQPKAAALQKAIMDTCDGDDGVKDGILSNPEKCRFDPATLLCKGSDSDTCLTAPQVDAVKRVFSDVKTRKGEIIWTGTVPGSELFYTPLLTKIDPNAPPSVMPLDTFRILGHQDPNWDWRTWDMDREVAAANEKAGFMDVHTYDLSAFKARGGKLLLYHGWADWGIPAGNTVNFYKGVLSKMGSKQDDWFRLFMLPGVGHCSGGPGPDQFNRIATIERWRESGIAPDRIEAMHVTDNTVDITRPLCPYPKIAVYKGSGSTSDAANFTCKTQ
jgi:feruloyl esterase